MYAAFLKSHNNLLLRTKPSSALSINPLVLCLFGSSACWFVKLFWVISLFKTVKCTVNVISKWKSSFYFYEWVVFLVLYYQKNSIMSFDDAAITHLSIEHKN